METIQETEAIANQGYSCCWKGSGFKSFRKGPTPLVDVRKNGLRVGVTPCNSHANYFAVWMRFSFLRTRCCVSFALWDAVFSSVHTALNLSPLKFWPSCQTVTNSPPPTRRTKCNCFLPPTTTTLHLKSEQMQKHCSHCTTIWGTWGGDITFREMKVKSMF